MCPWLAPDFRRVEAAQRQWLRRGLFGRSFLGFGSFFTVFFSGVEIRFANPKCETDQNYWPPMNADQRGLKRNVLSAFIGGSNAFFSSLFVNALY